MENCTNNFVSTIIRQSIFWKKKSNNSFADVVQCGFHNSITLGVIILLL